MIELHLVMPYINKGMGKKKIMAISKNWWEGGILLPDLFFSFPLKIKHTRLNKWAEPK